MKEILSQEDLKETEAGVFGCFCPLDGREMIYTKVYKDYVFKLYYNGSYYSYKYFKITEEEPDKRVPLMNVYVVCLYDQDLFYYAYSTVAEDHIKRLNKELIDKGYEDVKYKYKVIGRMDIESSLRYNVLMNEQSHYYDGERVLPDGFVFENNWLYPVDKHYNSMIIS